MLQPGQKNRRSQHVILSCVLCLTDELTVGYTLSHLLGELHVLHDLLAVPARGATQSHTHSHTQQQLQPVSTANSS